MSYYYCYSIGVMNKEGKIKPLGPYDAKGKLQNVVEKSRSFASDLHEYFKFIQENQITEELRKEYSCKNYKEEIEIEPLKYLEVDLLPKDSYLIKGYFLIEDIEQYEQGNLEADEAIVNMITPTIYAEKLKKECMFGKNNSEVDEDGYSYTEPNASDYMYYIVEDYNSKEYEAELLRNAAYILENDISDEDILVVIETEG